MKKIQYTYGLLLLCLIIFLNAFELYQGRNNYLFIMKSRAAEITETVIGYRVWAASVTNLYANTDKVNPNPYLEWKSDRDLNTADGIHLTMVNPSYMTKLVSEVLNKRDGFKLRMVGIRPINQDNKTSDWEETALQAIKAGAKDYTETVSEGLREKAYRYMKPLYMEKPCETCHVRNGFAQGELIGGLSLVIPSGEVHTRLLAGALRNVAIYTSVLLLFYFAALTLHRRIYRITNEQKETIDQLNEEIELRQKSEEALVYQTRAASQGELLSMVAHHWRQPLTVISLTLELLHETLNEEEEAEMTEDVYRAQQMLQDLSSNIDVFSQKYTSSDHTDETFSVTEAVVETLSFLEPVMISHRIKLQLSCSENNRIGSECLCSSNFKESKCPYGHYMLKGSRNDFVQILLSVAKNSYEAINEKNGPDRLVTFNVSFDNGYVRISIEDTGDGIPEDILPKVFSPYFSTKGYSYGRGTGLYFVQLLVKKFEDGDISLANKNGHAAAVISVKLSDS